MAAIEKVRDLSGNHDLKFRGFNYAQYRNLITLNLSYGDLDETEIKENKFKGLVNLKTLDLSHNKFETLPPDVFNGMDKLTEVRLHANRWDCDCEKGLMALLNSKPKIKLGPEPAKCFKPKTFKAAQTQINEHCAPELSEKLDRGNRTVTKEPMKIRQRREKNNINECEVENDCDDMAACRDFAFNYTCECNVKGFKGSGIICTDIDECERKSTNNCAKDGGDCINTHGSYECVCLRGFTGDGNTCTDIDECENHDCDQGECINSEGSFGCDCNEGYSINSQKVCVDIDECQLDNHTCDAIEHSYCLNLEKFIATDDGYQCLCETGYKKVGKSCVFEGDMMEWTKFLAMIIGGFFGCLLLIVIITVVCRKWRNRERKSEKEEETPVAVGPVVGLTPPIDFSLLGMPQTEEAEKEMDDEDWGEEDDYDLD